MNVFSFIFNSSPELNESRLWAEVWEVGSRAEIRQMRINWSCDELANNTSPLSENQSQQNQSIIVEIKHNWILRYLCTLSTDV